MSSCFEENARRDIQFGLAVRSRHLLEVLALLTLVGFGAVVAMRLGAFNVSASIDVLGDVDQRMFVSLAGVDHPFHATRAATLLESLGDGRVPRWMGDHQGGYPTEFYPLGGPWLDVVAWVALLGAVPIAAVHKLVVIAVFLMPLVGFLWLARLDHLPPTVAVTAGAAHLAMPGGSFEGGAYSGGYRELVAWGLFTNVTAAVEIFLVLPALVLFVQKGGRWAGVFAAAGAALAVASNPRSSIALAAVGVGVAIAIGSRRNTPGWGTTLVRLGVIAATAGLLAAPVLVSLIRYDALYHFVRYSGYQTVWAYLSASLVTLNLPVIALGIVGAIWAYGDLGRRAAKSVTLTAVIYVTTTIGMTLGGESGGPFQQLELTRLMPFQRLLLLYLAGVGVHAIAVWAVGGARSRWVAQVGQIVLAVAVFIGFVFAPFGGLAEQDRGLFAVPETDTTSMVSLRAAVKRADQLALPGSSLYVVGSALSWHQQLWTPLWTDRPIRYNDWLWSWQAVHSAPGYSGLDGNAFTPATVEQTFDRHYLAQEGIGAVIVTGADAVASADSSPALHLMADGIYRVYDVNEPTAVLTVDSGVVDELVVSDERITAHGISSGGSAEVRVSWFPRWQASVNGRSVPIDRTPDGYMSVQVPDGEFTVVVVYGMTAWDWIARAMSVSGVLLLLSVVVRPTRLGRGITTRVRSGRR